MNTGHSERAMPAALSVTIGELLAVPAVAESATLRAGAPGLARRITHPRIQKSGLALVGHDRGIVPTRIQILGETEFSFLEGLEDEARRRSIDHFFDLGLSLVVVTRGAEPLTELMDAATRTGTPLVVSRDRSSRAIQKLHSALDDLLAPQTTLHGVLIEVHGIGTLLLGPSGIGKSECALFLVERGHRLVADDQVELRLRPNGEVWGRPPPLLMHHLEVRGIGILNVRELFGATAVKERKAVHLVVELCPWREDEEYDRLGLDDLHFDLLGVSVPMLRVPVQPGRNMAVILEVAARNQLLKRAGHHAARRFVANLGDVLGVPEE